MRDDQQKASGPMTDGPGRHNDPAPARRFARQLDCGDDQSVTARRAAWPTARALGSPREGDDSPDAA